MEESDQVRRSVSGLGSTEGHLEWIKSTERGAISGRGERSHVEVNNLMWRGAITGGREQSHMEGSDHK